MDILVGGFNQRHLKNMLVKMGSSSPSFGVKIPKIFELPPPSFFLPHENNVEKLRQIPRASQKNLRKFGSLGRYAAFEGSRYQSSGSLFGCLGNCVPNSSFEISLDKALKSCKILESGRITSPFFFNLRKRWKKTPPIWRCPCNLMAIYLWIGLSIGWGRLRILIQRRVSDSAPSSH